MKYREHRGSLASSMETVKYVSDKESLIALIIEQLSPYAHGLDINENTVRCDPFGFDGRINWNSHIISLDGYGVLGFTDQEV